MVIDFINTYFLFMFKTILVNPGIILGLVFKTFYNLHFSFTEIQGAAIMLKFEIQISM